MTSEVMSYYIPYNAKKKSRKEQFHFIRLFVASFVISSAHRAASCHEEEEEERTIPCNVP